MISVALDISVTCNITTLYLLIREGITCRFSVASTTLSASSSSLATRRRSQLVPLVHPDLGPFPFLSNLCVRPVLLLYDKYNNTSPPAQKIFQKRKPTYFRDTDRERDRGHRDTYMQQQNSKTAHTTHSSFLFLCVVERESAKKREKKGPFCSN